MSGSDTSRLVRAPHRWYVLAVAGCIAGTACTYETEPDLTAATPWEVQPAATVDDGAKYWPGAQWRTALPAQVGMDAASMATLSRDVRAGKWPSLRSLLVVHRGYLVLNEYLGDAKPDRLQKVDAVTTTVTGLLVGVAEREGRLRADDGIAQYLPDYVGRIAGYGTTVDHLLAMRSGMDFTEEPYKGSDLENLNRSTGDWLNLIFSRPHVGSPGDRWIYNSGSAIVLGGILYTVTGEPADAYAKHALFGPLGITDYPWVTGQPNGLPQMATGLSLTPPDMARIGYLMLRKGRWNDAPIVSESWSARMRERKSRNLGEWNRYSLDYGRMLWILPAIGGGGDEDVLAASGGGGQWILIVPGKDLVVVATGDATLLKEFVMPIDLLYDVIVPAVH